MEDKRQEAGSPSPAATITGGSSIKSVESPATEPPPPRRRGQKRKSTTTTSSSAPPKRHAREKAAAAAAASSGGFFSLLPPIHNGPTTRARQLSDNNAAIFSALNAAKNESSMAAANDSAVSEGGEEAKLAKKEVEKLQAAIEAEFEAIRTRDSSVHVVPVAAGWFSWTSIHSIEKQTLHTFFNGKVENRTPDIYMEIRNWIMKKFHANPSTNIELKDLSELSVGDLDARQEIMEFLDHWGLINYHPFPQNDPNVDADPNTDADKAENTESLIEKLYQFENELSSAQLVPRASMSAAVVPSGLFPESFAEELVKHEGPAVEYHCNSCSADCSRKRYHCQKQADFDLCSDCYNDGKFGSGMCPSDFILMEPAEASGATGGKWTDQETLLLLEALELFRENWNEIAEHVATKTKAQCILHFLQMPIEDTFLDDDVKDGALENGEPTSTNNEFPVPKDNSAPSEGDPGKDDFGPAESGGGKGNPDPLASKASKDNAEPVERKIDSNAAQQVSTQTETSNFSKDAVNGKVAPGKDDDIVIKALKEAFHVAGCPLTREDELSFAEAGNSVMALAAFLTQLVEPNLATASSCISLKTISQSSAGLQLATKHSFILEDPPDEEKKLIVSESMASENIDQSASEMAKEESRNDKEVINTEEKSTPLLDESHSADGQLHEKKDSNTSDDPQLPTGEKVTGADNPQLSDKPDDEMLQVAEKPDEKSLLVEKPDEKSQIVEKPDEKSQNVEIPDERSQLLEKPDKEAPQAMEKSDKEIPQVTEKPDEEKPQSTERRSDEKPKATEKTDEEKPQVVEKPEEEKSQVMEKPDEQKAVVEEKPDEVTDIVQAGTKSVNEPQHGSVENEQSLTATAPKDQVISASEVMPPPGSRSESENLKTTEENVQCTDVPKDTDMEPSSVSDKAEQLGIAGAVPMVGVASEEGEDIMEVDKIEDPKSVKTSRPKEVDNVGKLKRAALATLSAAAVKAKLLANQEEDEIKQLATLLIEKQLRKLEIKLSYFTEVDTALMRVKEQLERSRQKLFNERAQIIASRLGMQSSTSRMLPSSYPMNRMPPSLLNSMLRPQMSLGAQRPPMSRPVASSAPSTMNISAPPEAVGGSPTEPSVPGKPSAVETN